MTVVCWDGKTLAADKRVTAGETTFMIRKIFRVGDSLVGGAGPTAIVAAMVAWLAAGAKAEDFPVAQRVGETCASILLISPDGQILQYEHTPYPFVVESRFWAIGSGAAYALAAMHLGENAREAVEVACALNQNCGNGIDTLELKTRKEFQHGPD